MYWLCLYPFYISTLKSQRNRANGSAGEVDWEGLGCSYHCAQGHKRPAQCTSNQGDTPSHSGHRGRASHVEMTTKGVPRQRSTPTSPATGWPSALQPLVLPHLALQAPHSHPHHAIPHTSSPVPQVCPGPGPHTQARLSPSTLPAAAHPRLHCWAHFYCLLLSQHHPVHTPDPGPPRVLSAEDLPSTNHNSQEDPAQTAKETVRTALTSSRKHSRKTLNLPCLRF